MKTGGINKELNNIHVIGVLLENGFYGDVYIKRADGSLESKLSGHFPFTKEHNGKTINFEDYIADQK